MRAGGGASERLRRLKQALDKGDVQTLEQLLDKGVDVETRLGFEWTPLMCAVNLAHHDMAKLLLDRGASANFSKGQFTVLMAGCMASASEDTIVLCVELLLSRNADPNLCDRSEMSCLMMAARDSHSKVINLLALAFAARYGRAEALLKLLQLGADKTIRTNDNLSLADLALAYKHTRVTRILTASGQAYDQLFSSQRDGLPQAPKHESYNPDSNECVSKLGDLELLLHGLKLGYLSDIMTNNDVTWSSLMSMEREDLVEIGITEPEDQRKVLQAVKDMDLDRVDIDACEQLRNIDSNSEEFYSYLMTLQQQSCYLTETVQDVIRRFPQRASEMVFSLDPNKEALGVCSKLLVQTGDLQRETDQKSSPSEAPVPRPPVTRRIRWFLSRVTVSTLGGVAAYCFFRMANGRVE
ncbi:hypothetical protein NHX12_003160 [Muraenolepis orangiensis]|uniref:SAM domain-containing protein n=1 Tax=Muraenolepis orangiensis TaxID=630683 RepID=A0A9Q0DYG0_9TELE|nr:hypothetical protein NHX12_003160 [Muraenolepis orangiensis]